MADRDEVLRAALSLPATARAEIAAALRESVRVEAVDLDPALVAELDEQADRVLAGQEVGAPAEQVVRELEAMYRR